MSPNKTKDTSPNFLHTDFYLSIQNFLLMLHHIKMSLKVDTVKMDIIKFSIFNTGEVIDYVGAPKGGSTKCTLGRQTCQNRWFLSNALSNAKKPKNLVRA